MQMMGVQRYGAMNIVRMNLSKIWHVTQLSRSKVATYSAVIVFEHGRRITSFVRPWSTMTNKESNLFTIGRSVIMSIEQFAKGLVV